MTCYLFELVPKNIKEMKADLQGYINFAFVCWRSLLRVALNKVIYRFANKA